MPYSIRFITSYRFTLRLGEGFYGVLFALNTYEDPVKPPRWMPSCSIQALNFQSPVCANVCLSSDLILLLFGTAATRENRLLSRAIHHHLVGRVFAGFCAEFDLLILIWFLRRSISPAMCSVSTGVVCSLSACENINFPSRQLARKQQAINCCQGRGFHRLKLIFCLLLGDSLCKLVGIIQFDFMEHSPGTP